MSSGRQEAAGEASEASEARPRRREARCLYCGTAVEAAPAALQEHVLACDLVPAPCPNACGALLQPRFLPLHLHGDCPRAAPDAAPDAAPASDAAPTASDDALQALQRRFDHLDRQLNTTLGEARAARAAASEEREARAAALATLAAAAQAQLDAAELRMRGLGARLAQLEDAVRRRDDDARPAPAAPLPHGRMVWRLDHIESRLRGEWEEAEGAEDDVALHSEPFFSAPLGHRLRLEVWAAGRGEQWRGRHLLATLRVLPCPWTPLLPPPALAASLTLRDQPDDPRQARNLTKPLPVTWQGGGGRGHGKSSGRDGIPAAPEPACAFIPHATLRQRHYIRHDAIILDVEVCDATAGTPI